MSWKSIKGDNPHEELSGEWNNIEPCQDALSGESKGVQFCDRFCPGS